MERQSLNQSRLASVLTGLAGLWLMLSPIWISISGAALTSLLITGAVMIVFSLIQLGWENTLPSWINALAAVWLFISAFSFSVSAAVVWNQVIFAIVTFVLATWDGAEISQVNRLHHGAA